MAEFRRLVDLEYLLLKKDEEYYGLIARVFGDGVKHLRQNNTQYGVRRLEYFKQETKRLSIEAKNDYFSQLVKSEFRD